MMDFGSYIGQLLGLRNPSYQYGVPSQVPQPGLGPRALLGPEQPPETVAPPTDSIQVAGSAPQRMSPQALGMPGLPNTRPPAPEDIADMRQQLRDKADLARQLYHPKSEFGTHGILRDVVGNIEDLGRRLLGFSPRYNDEKWTERAYGMTSSDPNVAAAATEQAMQYNPTKTMAYRQQLVGQDNAIANTEATTQYKNSQAQQKQLQMLSGYGQGLLNMSLSDPEAAQAQYTRAKPMIEQLLGGEALPDEYSPAVGNYLAARGYGGSNVQRERASVLSAANQQKLQQMRGDIQLRVQGMRGDAQLAAARILANSRLSIAEQERQLKMLPVEETETTEESGSIIRPTKTQTTTKSYAPGGQRGTGGARPAAPTQGGAVLHGKSNSGKPISSTDGGRTWTYD